MNIKILVELIQRNGNVAPTDELNKFFKKAIDVEDRNIELEKKLNDMTVQLSNTESQRRELEGENIKFYVTLAGISHSEEFYGDSDKCDFYTLVTAAKLALEAPATEAFLAEVRAQARNELIDELESRFNEMTETLPPELRSGAAGAAAFVSTFRKGAAL